MRRGMEIYDRVVTHLEIYDNLDNQCRDPMNKYKDFQAGQLTIWKLPFRVCPAEQVAGKRLRSWGVPVEIGLKWAKIFSFVFIEGGGMTLQIQNIDLDKG